MSANKTPNKLLKEITDEELLKILNESDDISSENKYTSNIILSFVQAFKFQHGKYLILNKLLYELFSLWNPSHNYNIRSFGIQLDKYLEAKINNRKKYYLINIDPIELNVIVEEHKKKSKHNFNKSKHYHTHFTNFIDKNNIESGSVFIESDIFYYVYNRWCDGNRKTPISYEAFKSICSLYFEKRYFMLNETTFYGVNDAIKNLINKEEVANWRKGREKHGRVKKELKRADGYRIFERGKPYVIYSETNHHTPRKKRIPGS